MAWPWLAALTDSLAGMFDVQRLQTFLAQFGLWTPAISFFLMVLQAVIPPLPTTPIASVNGMLYGVWPGMLLSWTGSVTGAALSYWIARHWGRSFVTFFFGNGAVDRFGGIAGTRAFVLVLMARLTPVISMDVIAYWAGVSRMNFPRYLLATAIGQSPHMLAYAVLGHDLARAQIFSWRLWIIAAGALILYVAGQYVFVRIVGSPLIEE
jgi:uncharacterized membrane protein YdjX (TVP38/TMEM64 family)